jgi:hypothetical protein
MAYFVVSVYLSVHCDDPDLSASATEIVSKEGHSRAISEARLRLTTSGPISSFSR